MGSSPTIAAQISEPGPAAREPALRLALCHLPPADRQLAVAQALTAGDMGDLLAAVRGGALVGALWGQRQPGRTASLCPPQLVDGEPAQTGVALLRAATERLSAGGIVLVQTLLETDAGADYERFAAAGFEHVCDLLYLASLAKAFPTSPPVCELEFVPVHEADMTRLAEILERTYEGTLDCPRLNGVRSLEDVLAGYRSNGVFLPERWLICRHAHQDVGCLLLAEHTGSASWELVYMGLLPEARGMGFGTSLVRYAQWLTGRAGYARLVLAVDASNGPAISCYSEAGFLAWDRRSVLLKVLTSGGPGYGRAVKN
jgi:ribosomal protein S18 acetylase RimI-like enzyme